MTKVNRTSAKHKKPGVYVDQSQLRKDSNQAYVKSKRAKSYAAIRAGKGAKGQNAAAVTKKKEEGEEAVEDEEDEDDGVHDGASSAHDTASAAPTLGLDGFTQLIAPYRTTDSSALATTTISKLKDEKVLGAALYEWLLTKEDWDCHTLWEKFLNDWDLITETERPPGTNRPINLHGYLTYLKSVNNKRVVRKEIREVRETLRAEREAHVKDHAEDDQFAVLNLQALNGTLLQYYLKIKQLIPYESKTQLKKKEALEKKRKLEMAGAGPTETKEGEPAEENEVVEHVEKEVQRPKKKAKTANGAPSAAAASSSTSSRPTSTLTLGRASCFAALLDCD